MLKINLKIIYLTNPRVYFKNNSIAICGFILNLTCLKIYETIKQNFPKREILTLRTKFIFPFLTFMHSVLIYQGNFAIHCPYSIILYKTMHHVRSRAEIILRLINYIYLNYLTD